MHAAGLFGVFRGRRMGMAVMDVGIMRMRMHQGRMRVLVGVRLTPIPVGRMLMLMVRAVSM